jgi:hypothetical protein
LTYHEDVRGSKSGFEEGEWVEVSIVLEELVGSLDNDIFQ